MAGAAEVARADGSWWTSGVVDIPYLESNRVVERRRLEGRLKQADQPQIRREPFICGFRARLGGGACRNELQRMALRGPVNLFCRVSPILKGVRL